MLAPIRDDPGDILRESAAHEESAMRTCVGTWLKRAALSLLVPALVAQTASGDLDSRRHPILEPAERFGVRARSERLWLRDPTPDGLSSISEAELIRRLSARLWRTQARNGVSPPVYGWLADASRYIERGDYEGAYRSLVHVPKWARRADQRQTLHIHALMSDLAARYVSVGNLERAARICEEMLLLGRYLPPQYTVAALNSLIATHFDRGRYEHALMYVRIGIAVLDDVGVGPYRAMDRIIGEVSRLGPVVDGFERDFDDALDQLDAAVAEAQEQGLVVEDQWWAPVYFARDSREEAIRILKTLVAPVRTDLGDILREATLHERTAQ